MLSLALTLILSLWHSLSLSLSLLLVDNYDIINWIMFFGTYLRPILV